MLVQCHGHDQDHRHPPMLRRHLHLQARGISTTHIHIHTHTHYFHPSKSSRVTTSDDGASSTVTMSAPGHHSYGPVHRGFATHSFLFCLVLVSSICATLIDSGSTDATSRPNELGQELLHFPVHRRGGPAGFTWRHARAGRADAGSNAADRPMAAPDDGDPNVGNGAGSGDGDADEDDDDDVVVNFSILDAELHRVATRLNMTKREMRGNKVVRKPKMGYERQLLGRVGEDGKWCVCLFLSRVGLCGLV